MRFILLSCLVAVSLAIVPLNHDNIPRKIAFGSCNKAELPQIFWKNISDYNPDAFVWLGDIIYADHSVFLTWRRPGDVEDVRRNYAMQLENEGYKAFLERVPVVGVWDDHDFGANDGDREFLHKHESQQLLLDFLHVPEDDLRRFREGAYVDYTFGNENNSTLKLILLDNRYFRDPYSPKKGMFFDSINYTIRRFIHEFFHILPTLARSNFTSILLPFRRLFWDLVFLGKLTFSSASNTMRYLFGTPLPRSSINEFTDAEMESFGGYYEQAVHRYRSGDPVPIIPDGVDANDLSVHFYREKIKDEYRTFTNDLDTPGNQYASETELDKRESEVDFFLPSFFELDIPLRSWTNSQDMLGKEQWEWFAEQLLLNSDVTVIGAGLQIIASGTPLLSESWSRHPQSRAKLLSLMAAQKIKILWSQGIFNAAQLENKRQGATHVDETAQDSAVPNLGAYVMIAGDVHHGDIHALQGSNIFGMAKLVEVTSSGMTHSWSPPLLSRIVVTAILPTTRFPNTVPYFHKNWAALEFLWDNEESQPDAEMEMDVGTTDKARPVESQLPSGPPKKLAIDIFGTHEEHPSHVIPLESMDPSGLLNDERLLDAVFACAHSGLEDGITVACEYVLHHLPPLHDEAVWERYLRNHALLAVFVLLFLILLVIIPACIAMVALYSLDRCLLLIDKPMPKRSDKDGQHNSTAYMRIFRPLLGCAIFIFLLYTSAVLLRKL